MVRFWALGYRYAIVAAVASVILFGAAIATGLGLKSFAILGAGAFWAVMAKYDQRRARAAARHRELRHRRLERMREGTWSGPRRDD